MDHQILLVIHKLCNFFHELFEIALVVTLNEFQLMRCLPRRLEQLLAEQRFCLLSLCGFEGDSAPSRGHLEVAGKFIIRSTELCILTSSTAGQTCSGNTIFQGLSAPPLLLWLLLAK